MVGIAFSEIEFADGTKVEMKAGDILVLTGPNNGGKSNVLRNLQPRILKLIDEHPQETIKSTKTQRTGSFDDLLNFLRGFYSVTDDGGGQYTVRAGPLGKVRLTAEQWSSSELQGNLTQRFAILLTARERFGLIDNAQCVSYDQTVSPLQKLRYAMDVEEAISVLTKRAFGLEILCHLDGTQLQLKTGQRSEFPTKDDYRTKEEQLKARTLPALKDEGDGIQSFTGILIAALVEPKSVILIDEAEAFLHPPQAKRLAQNLAKKTPRSTQLVIATHDYDLLRGLVSAGEENVHVVRIRRANKVTITKYLPNDEMKKLWSDPLLYTSDLLSALYHDVAVICEGDSDVRFLRAMMDALDSTFEEPVPDIRFYSCGSKGKLDKVTNSLKTVGVPTIVIADCDVLNSKDILTRILSSIGGEVADLDAKYVTVANAVNKAMKVKSAAAVVAEIGTELEIVGEMPAEKKQQPLSGKTRNKIRAIIEERSQWDGVKNSGRAAIVPLGEDVLKAFDDIRKECADSGFLINTVGELEGFWPEGPRSNKMEWLNAVLDKDLANDPALEEARSCVKEIVAVARRLVSAS